MVEYYSAPSLAGALQRYHREATTGHPLPSQAALITSRALVESSRLLIKLLTLQPRLPSFISSSSLDPSSHGSSTILSMIRARAFVIPAAPAPLLLASYIPSILRFIGEQTVGRVVDIHPEGVAFISSLIIATGGEDQAAILSASTHPWITATTERMKRAVANSPLTKRFKNWNEASGLNCDWDGFDTIGSTDDPEPSEAMVISFNTAAAVFGDFVRGVFGRLSALPDAQSIRNVAPNVAMVMGCAVDPRQYMKNFLQHARSLAIPFGEDEEFAGELKSDPEREKEERTKKTAQDESAPASHSSSLIIRELISFETYIAKQAPDQVDATRSSSEVKAVLGHPFSDYNFATRAANFDKRTMRNTFYNISDLVNRSQGDFLRHHHAVQAGDPTFDPQKSRQRAKARRRVKGAAAKKQRLEKRALRRMEELLRGPEEGCAGDKVKRTTMKKEQDDDASDCSGDSCESWRSCPRHQPTKQEPVKSCLQSRGKYWHAAPKIDPNRRHVEWAQLGNGKQIE